MLTCSVAQLCLTLWPPCTVTLQASLSFTISLNLLKLMSTESVMPSNHLIFCRPLLLLPSIFPSIRVFSNELALCIRWPKYWSFSFSISPSNKYSGLILGLTGLISLLSKRLSRVFSSATVQTILRHSAFFMVQLSCPYTTTWKIIALTVQTFSAKWCLCFLICCLGWSQLFFQGASVF